MENAKVFGAHFTSLFAGETCHEKLQGPEIRGNVWTMKFLSLEGEDQVREYKANIHKSIKPDPQVLRVVASVIVRPLSVIFERSGQTGLFIWAGEKSVSLLSPTRARKKSWGTTSLTFVTGVVIKQKILEIIAKHMKNKKMTRLIQHGFMKSK